MIGFNPYCYWSYLLTITKVEENIIYMKNISFQSLLLLVLSFNNIIMPGGIEIEGKSFNPYCYWSYLLTKEIVFKLVDENGVMFQSLLLLVLSFNPIFLTQSIFFPYFQLFFLSLISLNFY